jgi:conjugal transfer pilus assembly protein TraV
MNRLCFFPLLALVLGGCASLSGLDAQSDFSCKAASGVTCQSISGVAQNAEANNLPFQRGVSSTTTQKDKDGEISPYGEKKKMSPRDMLATFSGQPIREPPLVLRIWMAPYEDRDGDLHDQSYFYTQVHNGRWLIEATQQRLATQYRPVYPLNRQIDSEQKPVVPVPPTNTGPSQGEVPELK